MPTILTDSYEPTLDVQSGHRIPHFIIKPFGDAAAGFSDGTFTVSFDDRDGSANYFQSIIVLPIALLIIGILSIIIFQLVLWCRCFFRNVVCCQVNKSRSSFNVNTITFVSFVFFAFVMIHLVYIGNSSINLGVADAIKGFDELSSLFTDLSDTGSLTSTTSGDVKTQNTDVHMSCCPIGGYNPCNPSVQAFYDNTNAAADLMDSAGSLLHDLAHPVPDYIHTANTALDDYGHAKQTVFVYVYYALVAFYAVLFVLAGIYKKKVFLQVMIFFTEIILILLTIFCCITMIPVMLLGDYCMDPNANIVSIFSNGTMHDLLSFYVTCGGHDPVGSHIDDALNQTSMITHYKESLETALGNSITPSCTIALNDLDTTVLSLNTPLYDMKNLTQCYPMNQAWYDIVDQGVCTHGYAGLFEIWLSVFITSSLLFIAMCIASVLFKQFDHMAEHDSEMMPLPVSTVEDMNYVGSPSAPMLEFGTAQAGDGDVEIVTINVDGGNKGTTYNVYGVSV